MSFAHFNATLPATRSMVVCCRAPTFPISSENCVRGPTRMVVAAAAGEVTSTSSCPSAPVFRRSKFSRGSPSFTEPAARVSSSRTIVTAPSR